MSSERKQKETEHKNRWSIISNVAVIISLIFVIFELRQMGIPVSEYTPSRGNDKVARVNAVADLFASGVVWAPERRFSEEVIEEFAAFPSGEHDDLVDASTQALLRFRQGGFVPLYSDEEDEEFIGTRVEYY